MIRKFGVLIVLIVVVRSMAFELPQNFQTEALTQNLPSAVAVEKTIDPKSYLLGPGDVLQFSVWGGVEVHQILTVAPDGTVSIPTVGQLKVDGATLADTEEQIKHVAQPLFPGSKFSLRIIALREIKIGISGESVTSGVYVLSALDRLSALISIATTQTVPKAVPLATEESGSDEPIAEKENWMLFDQNAEPKPSLRSVQITNKSGVTRSIDFLRYRNTGKVEYNPVLDNGDNVFLPVMLDSTEMIQIFGAVKHPGKYEYLTGDSVHDLIELAGGFSVKADISKVTVARSFDRIGKLAYQQFDVDMSNANSRFELLPGDQLYVRSYLDGRNPANVKVTGEVNQPGVYPIQNGKTSLRDVIEASGGFTAHANLTSARIIRWSVAGNYDPEYQRVQKQLAIDMSKVEYEYFKTRSRNDLPIVVADFASIVEDDKDKSREIVLYDGDEIEIPFISATVNVIGYVNMPGLVSFQNGSTYWDYIDKAGGLAWKARKSKIRLLKVESDIWVDLEEDTVIEIGDTIFVPGKLETDYWLLFKEVVLVASQIATLLIVARTL